MTLIAFLKHLSLDVVFEGKSSYSKTTIILIFVNNSSIIPEFHGLHTNVRKWQWDIAVTLYYIFSLQTSLWNSDKGFDVTYVGISWWSQDLYWHRSCELLMFTIHLFQPSWNHKENILSRMFTFCHLTFITSSHFDILHYVISKC